LAEEQQIGEAMDPIVAFALLGVLLVIAWIVAKFILRLTARIIGCVLIFFL
jgi:hypothetical protein